MGACRGRGAGRPPRASRSAASAFAEIKRPGPYGVRSVRSTTGILDLDLLTKAHAAAALQSPRFDRK